VILTYEAIDGTGKESTATIDSPDQRQAVEQLRHKGLYVTRITKASDKGPGLGAIRLTTAVQPGKLPLKMLALITRQMSMLLRAGSGIVPAFQSLQRQMSKPRHAALIGQIVTNLEDGQTLTDTLRQHPRTFDGVYCAIVAAGEASGALTEMFERLAVIVGKSRAMRKKILGALAYPALLLAMCSQIFLVLLFFVLPRFNGMFIQLGVETPATTQFMLTTGDVLRSYWPIIAGAFVTCVLALVWTFTRDSGRQWASNMQLRIPIVGRLRSKLIQGQVMRTLGMLLESRVNLLEAVELTRQSTRNNKFQGLFDKLDEAISSGGRLSSAFEESGIVEPYIAQAIHTGEETANLGEAMSFCADILDETNEEFVNVVTKLIEPLILILLGVVVGGVAFSLFIPLFDMTSAIR
jgi:type IV pilus assembly protein PilC